jgi:flagellar basal body P-ring protein FlgI
MKNNPVRFISIVENLDVKPDVLARIVVDEKTGTIVIGENVRISTIAISHGNLSVQIKEDEKVSQPLPMAKERNGGDSSDSHESGRREGTFLSYGRWNYHQGTGEGPQCRGGIDKGCYYHTSDH